MQSVKLNLKEINLIDSIYLSHYSRTRTHGDLAFERFFFKLIIAYLPPKSKNNHNLLFLFKNK